MSSNNSHHDDFQWPPLFDDNGNILPSSPTSPISDHGCPVPASRSSTDDDWYGEGLEEMPAFDPANIPLPTSPSSTGMTRNSAPESFSASRAIVSSPTIPRPSTIAVALQPSIENARDTLMNLQVLEGSCNLENLSDTLAESINDSVQRAHQIFHAAKKLHNSIPENEPVWSQPKTDLPDK